jgi:hypothetical protein
MINLNNGDNKFSAPKSSAGLWAFVDDMMRQQISEAQTKAIKSALEQSL